MVTRKQTLVLETVVQAKRGEMPKDRFTFVTKQRRLNRAERRLMMHQRRRE